MTFNQELFNEIVQNRRYLHQHPELSFQETNTARFIAEKLKSYGIQNVIENVGKKGVVVTIKGPKDGPTIAFRADFDALPIEDEKDVPYKSTKPGVMHACGHDGHTAALLAFAKLVNQHANNIAGTIKLIFQPAEEKPPGGAKFMIEAGVLEDVDLIFGAHLATDLPVGTVSTNAGPLMASADAFTIKIIGKGGHGAYPHQTKDSIIAVTQLIQNLQQIVSRRINPSDPAVLTIGSIHAGNAFNVIADSATIEGTVRTLNTDVQVKIKEEMIAILEGLKLSNHIDYELDYLIGYPVLINSYEEAKVVESIVKNTFGVEQFITRHAVLGAEDFAYYLQHVPGNFFYVGAQNDDINTQFPHHHPKFDFDERALLTILSMFIHIAKHYNVVNIPAPTPTHQLSY